ncbi:MAG: hypothetical protein Q9182_004573 [Xanthomendoza sp. 2 TL-2023]
MDHLAPTWLSKCSRNDVEQPPPQEIFCDDDTSKKLRERQKKRGLYLCIVALAIVGLSTVGIILVYHYYQPHSRPEVPKMTPNPSTSSQTSIKITADGNPLAPYTISDEDYKSFPTAFTHKSSTPSTPVPDGPAWYKGAGDLDDGIERSRRLI